MEWINRQSNLSDAIRYLIEDDIKQHAIRDLQEYIPAKRKSLESFFAEKKDEKNTSAEEDTAQGRGRQKTERTEPVGAQQQVLEQQEEKQEPRQEEDDDLTDELVDHWMNL